MALKCVALLAWICVFALSVVATLSSNNGVGLGSDVSSGSRSAEVTIDPVEAARVAKLLEQKRELCQKDYWDYNRVLKLMTVNPRPRLAPRNDSAVLGVRPQPGARYPRIFCYVNTITPYHKSHAQLVANTWAQRCDKTVFFSNDTGVLTVNAGTTQEISFPVIKMHAPADYHHLWMKHKEVIKYIHDHYRHDFDWFYKADDDAYVVVDNLRDYLRRPEIVNNYKRRPLQIGKRFNLTADGTNAGIRDKAIRERWWKQWDRWVFNSGGPGYAMNRLFLDKFVASMPQKRCFAGSETEPEDTSTAFCMMWYDVVPWDTRDLGGRPRWHAYNPGNAYGEKPKPGSYNWIAEYSEGVGGFKWGDDCCAPDSIGFHYVKLGGVHHFERTMYFCRTGDDIPDIPTYNDKFNLGISHDVATFQPV